MDKGAEIMYKVNPFLVAFGQKPQCYVSRITDYRNVVDNFNSVYPPTMCYMITGVRGSGKTVFLTELTDYFKREDWIVVDLIPDNNMISSLISHLANNKVLNKMFIKADISINAFGVNVGFNNEVPAANEEIILERMFKVLADNGKRLLIAIDEVVNNEYVQRFASLYQLWIRQNYPIFFLMTGLYENIYELQNEKTLTFLYRAPKIHLKPLDRILVAEEYKNTFEINDEEAYAMADIVDGYSYAFQILGYLKWDNKEKEIEDILPQFDYMLKEYSYDKIWSEMSDNDRVVVREIAKQQRTTVKELRDRLDMPSNKFSVYRDRLIKKGIVDVPKYGEISLILPRFKEYIEHYQEI